MEIKFELPKHKIGERVYFLNSGKVVSGYIVGILGERESSYGFGESREKIKDILYKNFHYSVFSTQGGTTEIDSKIAFSSPDELWEYIKPID